MRIAVLGAGAIGAYVGAALARGGAEVHLIARGAHMEAMRRDGVRVTSPRGDFGARPHVTDDPTEVGAVDVVFLGLKAHAYAAAGGLLAPLLGPRTPVVAAQNGIPWWYFHGLPGPHRGRRVEAVDPEGRVSAAIAPERAIGCVVYASTEIVAPGVVRHVEGTRFSIGEPDGSDTERCRRFSEAMVAGGLKCPVVPDLRAELWVKLMGNVAFNPISALTRATLGDICGHAPTRRVVSAAMAETLAVARSLGSEPAVSIERRIEGAERVGDHKSSTLQDLEAGKALELDVLTTAVLELAGITGVATPTLSVVHALSELLGRTVAS
jgi:2-dehydropantoate 2-reductase